MYKRSSRSHDVAVTSRLFWHTHHRRLFQLVGNACGQQQEKNVADSIPVCVFLYAAPHFHGDLLP